jgi:hypothetical protein
MHICVEKEGMAQKFTVTLGYCVIWVLNPIKRLLTFSENKVFNTAHTFSVVQLKILPRSCWLSAYIIV